MHAAGARVVKGGWWRAHCECGWKGLRRFYRVSADLDALRHSNGPVPNGSHNSERESEGTVRG